MQSSARWVCGDSRKDGTNSSSNDIMPKVTGGISTVMVDDGGKGPRQQGQTEVFRSDSLSAAATKLESPWDRYF